jgi:3',5'-cyclic-AMP phosphodiesterase
MDIVYAGTASSTRFRGFPKNTYNILDIKSNGKVSIDLKIVGATCELCKEAKRET